MRERRSEWLHILLGFLCVCLVANTLALVILYLHVEKTVERFHGSDVRGVTESPSPLDGAANEEEVVESADALVVVDLPLAGTDAAPLEVEPEEATVYSAMAEKTGRSDAEFTHVPAVSAEDLVDQAWAVGVEREAEKAPVLSGGPPVSVLSAVPSFTLAPFPEDAPLFRLLLVEEVNAGAQWLVAWLFDSDLRVRESALRRLQELSEIGSLQGALLGTARPLVTHLLASLPEGSTLAAVQGLFPNEPVGGSAQLDDLRHAMAEARGKANEFLSQKSVGALRSELHELGASGLDLVVLIDVSQSMEEALPEVQRQVERLWGALSWALPDARFGTVLYRDTVVASYDFSVPIDRQLVGLKRVVAAGGGDVPEAVDVAIKHALSLGSFHWRTDSSKHLVLLGDAPPRFASQSALLSFVGNAHKQGGYRFHSFFFAVEPAASDIDFFSRLAKAGGGVVVLELGVVAQTCVSRLFGKSAAEWIAKLWSRL